MPSKVPAEAIKEAYAHALTNVVVYDTIEIASGISSTEIQNTDIAFLVDTSGSMSTEIGWLRGYVVTLFQELSTRFKNVRFAVVQYSGLVSSGLPVILQDFTSSASTIEAVLGNIETGGSRERVFDTIDLAVNSLTWSKEISVSKNVFVLTDEDGEDPGQTATEASVEALLRATKTRLFQTYRSPEANTTAIGNLQVATSGKYVPINVDEQTFVDSTTEALSLVQIIDPGLEAVFLVKAPEAKTFTLENGQTKVFEPVAFRLQLPPQNDQGVSELMFSVDNVDERISTFVNQAEKYDIPVTLRYRPYLSTDTSTPQYDPPIELVLSDISIDDTEASGRAVFADIVNLEFLTEYYTRANFPSLGNT